MNGCHGAVAIVPESAYQDAQADTSLDGYAGFTIRVVEVESPCSRPKAKGSAPSLRSEQLGFDGVIGVQFVQTHQVGVRTHQRV